MAETKPKPASSLRTPQPKKKLGLSVPPALRLPHDDLIVPQSEQSKQKERNESPSTMPSQTSMPSQTRHSPSEIIPVAPERDFTKVANSINRHAVPAGLFTGKSKQLYDCLYSLTRGAVTPSRTVRISRPKLMKKAGIGSRATFEANVERLVSVGLVTVRLITGEHKGNEYTVFLPEEVQSSMPSQTSQTTMTSLTGYAQKLDRLVRLETSQTRHTSNLEESTTYTNPNTSFKTNTNNDDEWAKELNSILKEATFNLTGSAPTPQDRTKWAEVGNILVKELNEAAARSGTISSVPAFLTAHLKRCFASRTQQRKDGENRTAPTPAKLAKSETVGKPSEKRLRPEEVEEQARIIMEVIEGGYTLEQATEQFSKSFHPEDWTIIKKYLTQEPTTTETEKENETTP